MNRLEMSPNGVMAKPLAPSLPDPEVRPRRRRSYSAAYKLKIVEEADLCTQPGQIGALLRREGLYSSLLAAWRRQFRQGGAPALEPHRRGRPPLDAAHRELDRLQIENARLTKELANAQLVIDVQKKVAALLDATTGQP
jgi:transposase-like protein